MSDASPFDNVRPIGEKRPGNRRTDATAAPPQNGHGASPVGPTGDPGATNDDAPTPPPVLPADRRRFASTRHLTNPELLGMISARLREANIRAADLKTKEADRKHAAVSFGIFTEKYLLVSGRPTEIIAIDAVRPEAHDLAAKLALVKSRRP